MSELFEKSIRTLELPAVLEMLSAKAVSEAAREKSRHLLPATDRQEVLRLLDETDAAKERLGLYGSPSFAGVRDVSEPLARADRGGMLNTRELLNIAGLLTAARRVSEYDAERKGEATAIDRFFSALHTNKYLEDRIHGAILDEETIADTASAELTDIRRKMRIAASKGRQILQKIISSPSYAKVLQEALITQRDGRFVVPVKAECKGSIPGLVHDISSSGATLFVEPMGVVQANNELKELEAREEKEIERILRELSAQCADAMEYILLDYDMLVHLDMIFARAQLSYAMDGSRPEVVRRGAISLKRARHPLLDRAKAVPVTVELGGDYDTLVITGPNTGGKTVTLKTVGLLSLMAQAGMQIPAAYGSELAIFDEIFADIGDEQSIEQSLSTFSSHMTNIVDILDRVTENSLVLFDELGAGTDPTEGAALAMAILNRLLENKVRTMATTHYSELKVFALSTPGVENASVEFNVETLRPTYRLSIGVPGKSNAFEISRKLGLPEEIIDSAKEKLSGDQVRFEDVIANAEYHRQIAEKERKLAEEAHLETQRLRDEAEKLRSDLAAHRERDLRKAKDEARRILQRAQRESEQLIADLKKKNSGELKEHELHAMRAKLQSAIDENAEKIEVPAGVGEVPKTVQVGDTVELTNLGTKATILTLPDSRGECTVQAGALKLKAKLRDMRTAQPDKPKKQPKSASRIHVAARPVETECDVRGCNLEEALLAVDLFLDGAVLNRLRTVSIIHGKGTGILRAGIHKHLKTHAAVKEFRLGRYGEGEDGVTIVTLK